MTSRRFKPFFALFLLCFVSGCGTMVPQMQEIWDAKSPNDESFVSAGGVLEKNIKRKIYCEIQTAVHDVGSYLPADWGVQYTLSLTVDETTALNPGVALVTPMHAGITNFKGEVLTNAATAGLATATYPFLSSPQQYSLGLGGILSSQGTRVDKFGAYWNLDRLYPKNNSCLNAP